MKMGKVREKNSKSMQEKRSEVEGTKRRKNMDKKKNSDESIRKFGYISANSVISMAESAGFSGIQEDVAKNLAEDVTYRLRYIIQQCKKFMDHSKHKKLSSSDINEVLKMCDVPAIYGYTTDKPLYNFIYIKEADLFVLDDDVVDLPTFALGEILVRRKPSYYATGMWLKSEDGKIKTEIKTKNSEIKGSDQDIQDNNENVQVSSKNLLHCESHKTGNENEENETKIPTNLIKYYGITCNTILGHSDLKIIFQDLSSNRRITPIIPYMLNFITIALNKLNSERQLKRLLQTIEALSKNKNIDFAPYSASTRVINAMLLIVASDKKPGKISYDFQLRSYAGWILSVVLYQWCSRDEQRQIIVKKMGKLLGDFKISPKVHYGAIALLTFLGGEALSKSLWIILEQYLDHLEEVKQSVDFKTGNDVAMLEEVILGAAVWLYKNPKNEMFYELDSCLSSYFGDAIYHLRLNSLTRHGFLNSFKVENNGEKKLYSKCLKYMNSRYKPKPKKLSLDTVFTLPKPRKRKNTRIIFKFAGSIPVPEVILKRRRFASQYAHFIAGKESEGHVVVAGKTSNINRSKLSVKAGLPYYYLMSLL